MKVLFFYIDSQTSSGYTTGLGIASISGYIKKRGVDTELVYYKTDSDFNYAIKKINTIDPDIIGFYSTSSNRKTVCMLSQEIRKRFPDIFQIYGGIHATLVPETLNAVKSLDAICVGYGEVPMLELIERIEKNRSILHVHGLWVRQWNNGAEQIIQNPAYFPENSHNDFLVFDHQVFLKELTRFSDFDPDNYRLEIIFNRGCPFNCTFCCNHRLNKIYDNCKFRPSPGASIEALKTSLQSTNLKVVEIHDDVLTLHKKWFREFIERYATEIKTPFICNLRVGTFDEEDIVLLKKANVQIAWVGIESGNEYIRNTVMNKKISKEQIVRAFNLLHKYDIPVITQNIIGVPYETPKHFIDTICINAEVSPADHQLSVFYPYPKTELFEISTKAGWIDSNTNNFVERVDPVMDTPDFPKKKIAFYFRNFERLVKYQKLRLKKPYIYFLPLTHYTSYLLVGMMSIRKSVSQILQRIGFLVKIWHLWQALKYRGLKFLRVGRIRFGNLRQLTPINRVFGLGRGYPIDRYYIEQFLARYALDIQGRVLEIGDNFYTRKFGGDKVIQSDVLHAQKGNPEATVVADLTCADHIPSEAFDCIICTQTLQCIYDVHAATQMLHRILKPGGVLLATFAGISQISRYDMDRWGEYWRFTSLSVRKLLQEIFSEENITVETYGNVLAAIAFLHGLAVEDLTKHEVDYRDPDYELTITVRAVK